VLALGVTGVGAAAVAAGAAAVAALLDPPVSSGSELDGAAAGAGVGVGVGVAGGATVAGA
jgi:hypothetical protein